MEISQEFMTVERSSKDRRKKAARTGNKECIKCLHLQTQIGRQIDKQLDGYVHKIIVCIGVINIITNKREH